MATAVGAGSGPAPSTRGSAQVSTDWKIARTRFCRSARPGASNWAASMRPRSKAISSGQPILWPLPLLERPDELAASIERSGVPVSSQA